MEKEQRKKLSRRMRIGLITTGIVAAIAIPVSAEEWECQWDHPCTDDPGSTLLCNYTETQCWCDADWNVAGNWSCLFGGYPDDTDESVRIMHSNVGYCDGGFNNGDACSDSSDCPGCRPAYCPCDDIENHVIIELTDEIVGGMKIETRSTDATDESLTVHFESKGKCVGGGNPGASCNDDGDCTGAGTCEDASRTLDSVCLTLKATYGPVTLVVQDSAEVDLRTALVLHSADGEVTLRVKPGSGFETSIGE